MKGIDEFIYFIRGKHIRRFSRIYVPERPYFRWWKLLCSTFVMATPLLNFLPLTAFVRADIPL